MAKPLSPYRSLPPERRIELVTQAIKANRESRMVFMHRLASRPGGFRPVTLQAWSVDRLAREVVRLRAESTQDEFDLLHFLYVELEPEIQITFLDTAGVEHESGRMPDELEAPYTDAAAVRRAADTVIAKYGEEGVRYVRTLALYNAEGWPGIEEIVAGQAES